MSRARFNLSAWALKHRSLMLYLMLVLSIAGVFGYSQLGQKEDPEFTFKAMIIHASWPGATASEVEEQLTDKLEKAIQGIPEIDYTQSYSRAGAAQILVSLQENVSSRRVPYVWYQIRKRISDMETSLPAGVVGPVFNDEFGDTFGNLYAFTGDGFNFAELKKYVEIARDELLRIPDVNKVELIGAQDEKIYVEYANAKLASLGISPLQINQLIAATNTITPAGIIDGASERVYVRVSGGFDALTQLRQLPITVNGATFRLGEVAQIRRAAAYPQTTGMRYQGQPAIGLGISMKQGGDVLKMGRQIDNTLAQLRQNFPVGVEYHAVSDQPAVVKQAIHTFTRSLFEAVLIVLAVSFMALGLRTGIVVALSIPLVLALTFLCMWVLDIELQRISLGALVIALGLLVDDAIIAVEMMALKLEQGWDRFRAATFAYSSTAFPMLTGTLITAAGFLPVGLARSNAGEYTFSILAVVGIALIVSWIVAVLFTPFLGFQLLPESVRHAEHDVYQGRFYRMFRRAVTCCMVWRKTTVIVTVLAFALSLLLFGLFVPKQFFPASERPELMVDIWLPYTASYQSTAAEVKRLETILINDPGVASVTSYVGTGSPRFYLPLEQQLPNLNYAQLMVMTRNAEVREQVRSRICALFAQGFPQVRGRVTRLENGPPVGYPVQFRISGADTRELKQIGARVANILRQNPYAQQVNPNWGESVNTLHLIVDQDRLRLLGLSTGELAGRLQMALSGVVATQFRDGHETIDVVTRLNESDRGRLDAVNNLPILLPGGKTVPLAQLAHIQLQNEESLIWRRNRQKTLTLRADVEGAEAPEVTQAVLPKIQALEKTLPAGYHIEVGGTAESSEKSQAPIRAVMPLMLLIVATLLMVQLQSIRRTIMVLLSAPLGMIGVTLALLVFQAPFGFVATLGVIALAGMIMRNSVILMVQIEQDIAAGVAPWHAVIESAVRRFRPIVLTAAAAILAMIPLTRDILWGPMAIAIMGGLFVATILTLLFLPALYVLWQRIPVDSALQADNESAIIASSI